MLRQTNANAIVDLCSGGSGPWVSLKKRLEGDLGQPIDVTLTDKFPNQRALERARDLAGVAFGLAPALQVTA